MMKRAIVLLVLSSLATAQAQDATSQPADARCKVRAVRVTEIRHAAMQGRKGTGAQPATETPAGLHVRLECIGRPVGRAIEIGELEIKGRDDRERKVVLQPESELPTSGFVVLDRRAMFAPNPVPKNRIWVDLLLTLPSRDATAIDLEGSFSLQVAKRERIQIKELVVGPIEHPKLVEAGLTVEVTRVGDLYVVLKVGGAYKRFDEAQIIGGQRQEIGLNTVRQYQDDAVLITHELSGPTAGGGMVLQVDVPTGTLRVPVQLEKLPLP